jgi:hypothetical protein
MILIKNVLVLFLLLVVFSVSAQEYILLKTGDKITANIISITNDNLSFKLFDEADTTLYFLKKENVLAIGFGSDIYKRLKGVKQKNESAIKPINAVALPDFIYPKTEEKIKVHIDSITPTHVLFRMASSTDTSQYAINKSDVFQICFRELQSTETTDEPVYTSQELRLKGQQDARVHYNGYKAPATIAYLTGLFIIYGLPFPIVSSLVEPAEYSLGYPNINLAKQPIYANAYKTTAHGIKAGKVWVNYGAGMATTFAIVILLAFSFYR